MSRPTRFERRKPLVCTAKPSDSSHSCNKAICVDRPDPSMPSMTIRLPVISLGSTPTSGSPKKYCDEASSAAAAVFAAAAGGAVEVVVAAGVSVGVAVVFSFSWSGMVTPVLEGGSKALELNFGSHDVAHLFLQFVHRQCAV